MRTRRRVGFDARVQLRYFCLAPPTIHSTLVALDRAGAISRQPGVPRSIQVTIPAAEIPDLDGVDGPPW